MAKFNHAHIPVSIAFFKDSNKGPGRPDFFAEAEGDCMLRGAVGPGRLLAGFALRADGMRPMLEMAPLGEERDGCPSG